MGLVYRQDELCPPRILYIHKCNLVEESLCFHRPDTLSGSARKSENSRRLWLFLGSARGSREFGKIAGNQETREGCGCPKFPAGKVFWQISTLLENDSPIFRQREMLSLPRFGHFPARKTAAGNIDRACGNAAGFSPLRPPRPS